MTDEESRLFGNQLCEMWKHAIVAGFDPHGLTALTRKAIHAAGLPPFDEICILNLLRDLLPFIARRANYAPYVTAIDKALAPELS